MARPFSSACISASTADRHAIDQRSRQGGLFAEANRPVTEAVATGGERQILTLVAQGKTSAVIADEIVPSRRTVEAHRLLMMRQVGVRNTAEPTAWFFAS